MKDTAPNKRTKQLSIEKQTLLMNGKIVEQYQVFVKERAKQKVLKLVKELQHKYNDSLKIESRRVEEELERVRSLPLTLATFTEMVSKNYAVISGPHSQPLLARVMSSVNRELLTPNATIAIHRLSSAVIGVIPPESDSEINAAANSKALYSDFVAEEDCKLTGYETQQREISEALELPLQEPKLYQKLGIEPPKGVLLYGPPGTGKTLSARVSASKSNLPFIKVVASEFIQKYLGEGPAMVRNVFRLAREKAPCVVFIDEIDAVGTKRFDSQIGADREVQRVLIEILTQMDGFDSHDNVKVVMATNRIDTLDPALLRPGRLDRKIEFPYPDMRARRMIFGLYTEKMTLNKDVEIERLVMKPARVSGADIKSVCREAGLNAIRNNRYKVSQEDFEEAYAKVTKNIGMRVVGGHDDNGMYV